MNKSLRTVSFALVALSFISGCASIKPWSKEDIVESIITSAITGDDVAIGNEAQCNMYKMSCKGKYRQWQRDGEIACSCSD